MNNELNKPNDNNDRYNFFTEWLPYPIIELDSSFNIVYLNQATELQFPNLTSLKTEHPILNGLEKMRLELFQTSSEIIVYERELEVYNLTYEQQIFAFPKTKKLFLFMTDTTKRKHAELARLNAEAQLYQAQKMEAMGELTGGIAHDFNNLLMIILGNLQLQQAENKENNIDNKRINAALEAALRGSALSKRLLNFARRKSLQPTVIVMEEFIPELTNLIKPVLGATIDLEIQLSENLWKIMVDRNQFENAILNLAVNASHAMDGKGKLTLNVSNVTIEESSILECKIEPGEYIKISISDTGVGIENEIIDKIFEPFFSTKGANKGTGLGLSMVSAFVVQSNGHITVDSTLHKGTTFNLFFPRVKGELPDEVENIATPNLPKKLKYHHNKSILVVEDEESIRNVVVEYLKKLHFKVLEAHNGDDAFEIVKTKIPIDLILSDIAMPGKRTGIELANEVQKMYPKIKILLTSGHLSKEARERCKYPILTKPYELEKLASILNEALEEN